MTVTELAPTHGPVTASGMSLELDRLRSSIADQLKRAGVERPDAELSEMADLILTDAVRLTLLWVGERSG